MPAPSDKTPDLRERSNGRLARSGSPLCEMLSPLAIKLATPCRVIGASAPPAMASSVSPERIIFTADATASTPEGQADETVVACAPAPMRLAITFAAACGFDAPRAIGETPFSPRRSESTKTRSMTSKALVLTPTTTGVGLGRSEAVISKPASSIAIIAAA